MAGVGWGRRRMEEKYKSKQTNNKKHGRLWDSVLKALGTANTIAIKKQVRETGRYLPWDTQQVQIVGTGVLFSEQGRMRRHREGCRLCQQGLALARTLAPCFTDGFLACV